MTQRTYTFEQKWGDDPFTAMGHTQAPNALIRYAAQLGLDPDECWLIVVIMSFKHTPADPFPKQGTLAEMLGLNRSTVNRKLAGIAAKGYLKIKEPDRTAHGHFAHTVYDFENLRKALNTCYYLDHPQERPKAFKTFKLHVAPSKEKQSARGIVAKRQRETVLRICNTDGDANPQHGRVANSEQSRDADPQQHGDADLHIAVLQSGDSIKDSESENGKENLNRGSGGSILSLPKIQEIPKWATLCDIDRDPWRNRAKAEIGEQHLSGPNRRGVIDKAVDRRAQTLYEQATKKG